MARAELEGFNLGRFGTIRVAQMPVSYSKLIQLFSNDFIVDELSKNRCRAARGCGFGRLEGVADAKAHAVVFRQNDVHGGRLLVFDWGAEPLYYKVLRSGGGSKMLYWRGY